MLWMSGTRTAAVSVMQKDGSLAIYGAGAKADWASHTSGNPGSLLRVQDDGNVVIYRTDSTPLWATNTVIPAGPTAQGNTMRPGEVLYPGQSIHSSNGNYTLILQPDGNLVLYSASGVALWSSKTDGRPVAVTTMQADGNLVLYESGPKGDLATHTSQNPRSHLIVQDDGNVVIYRADGSAIWATNTVQPVTNPTAPLSFAYYRIVTFAGKVLNCCSC
jgi:hypothetical protein